MIEVMQAMLVAAAASFLVLALQGWIRLAFGNRSPQPPAPTAALLAILDGQQRRSAGWREAAETMLLHVGDTLPDGTAVRPVSPVAK
jgi:hypothetical protein